jgi:hypothetical protein
MFLGVITKASLTGYCNVQSTLYKIDNKFNNIANNIKGARQCAYDT